MERINCSVDELAEALAVVLPYRDGDDPNRSAREIASFLNADRLPEPPELPDFIPIEELEWWEK